MQKVIKLLVVDVVGLFKLRLVDADILAVSDDPLAGLSDQLTLVEVVHFIVLYRSHKQYRLGEINTRTDTFLLEILSFNSSNKTVRIAGLVRVYVYGQPKLSDERWQVNDNDRLSKQNAIQQGWIITDNEMWL